MTREEELDWLYRLRSEIYVYMPKEWLIPMNNALDMAIKALEQELKTGHWILKRTFPTKLYDEYLNEYKCSECYREIRCSESQLVNYPYCHCGAKMIEPQESEEV